MGEWQLSSEQRADTVERIKENLATMHFFSGKPRAEVAEVAEVHLGRLAGSLEKRAYTVATVESRTTTGFRPHHETLKAYARKLSALVLDAVNGDLEMEGVGGPEQASDGASLDLTGAREFLTADIAEEKLASMLVDGSTVSRIKFSTKSFGVDAAHVAARAIRNIKATLKHADMSDIIAGRPEDEALQALSIISEALADAQLESLDLSDNALGEKGIRACAKAYAGQKTLRHIAFQNVGCSVHGCAAVDELLVHCSEMRSIHLLNNMSGCEGAASIANVIARCPRLEDFKMASSRVGSDGGLAIAKALASCGKNLVSIDLHDNPLTHEVSGALAEAIGAHPGLRRVNLNDTIMENTGIEKLAVSLARAAQSVEHVELQLNEVTPEGAAELAASLSQLVNLRHLDLSENELEDDGALEISKGILGLKQLEIIDVRTNMIKRGGAVALAKACCTLPNVKELRLDDNNISSEGIDHLKEVLRAGNKEHVLMTLDENCSEDDDEFEDAHATLDSAVDELVAEIRDWPTGSAGGY
jgi:Ran GTPase-activating protein (RanGAP) involved in mRNA processing and transport